MAQVTAPLDGWKAVGKTTNTQYFLVDPDVLVVMPDANLKDDGASATMNTDFQLAFARQFGRRLAVVVQMSRLLGQDADARRVYAERIDSSLFYAAGLVASSAMARAIASFFLGLTKPPIPTRVHDSFASALAWVAEQRPENAT